MWDTQRVLFVCKGCSIAATHARRAQLPGALALTMDCRGASWTTRNNASETDHSRGQRGAWRTRLAESCRVIASSTA